MYPSNSVKGSISKESSISERTSVPPSPKDVPEIYSKNKPNTLDRKKGQSVAVTGQTASSVNSEITQDLMEDINSKSWTEQVGKPDMEDDLRYVSFFI